MYEPYTIDAMEAPVMASMPYASPINSCDSTLSSSEEGMVSRLYIMNAITSEKKPTNKTLKPLSLKPCHSFFFFFSSMSDELYMDQLRLQIKSYRGSVTLNSR